MEKNDRSVPVDMEKKEFILLELEKKYNVDSPDKFYVNRRSIVLFYEDIDGESSYVVCIQSYLSLDEDTMYLVTKECFERLIQELA